MKRAILFVLILFLLFQVSTSLSGQTGYPLQPVSGADGIFETLTIDGGTVYRSKVTTEGYNNFILGSGQKLTAVFELPAADFRDAQNLETDLWAFTEQSMQMHILWASVYLEPTALFKEYIEDWTSPYEGPLYMGNQPVNSNSLTGKVICGYQG